MRKAFFFFLAGAAVFVWWSAGAMPEVVASHFTGKGLANGFMPRGQYVGLMLTIVLLVPLLLFFMGRLAARLPTRFVNLPHRQYWLAPERRAATLASLGSFGVWVAYATLALLCVIHGLVLRANLQHPPLLEQAPMVGTMALFFLALFVGMVVVLRKFFRV